MGSMKRKAYTFTPKKDGPYQLAKRARQVRVARPLRSPVPYTLKTSLKYQEAVTLTPTAGTEIIGVHVFSANGLYDPNITGVGHQPRGFDQLMALYDHCVCIGSSIVVDFPAASGATAPAMGMVAVRDFTTVGTLFQDYMELGDCKYMSISGPGGYMTRLVMNVNPNAYLGRSKPLGDPNLKNSNAANPSEQCYWHVAYGRASGTDVNAIRANIVITYTVVFIEPRDPGAS